MPLEPTRQKNIVGSDNVMIAVETGGGGLRLRYRFPRPLKFPQNIFLALGTQEQSGTAVLPFGREAEGSTVFLPFQADRLLFARITNDSCSGFIRRWEHWRWSEREEI